MSTVVPPVEVETRAASVLDPRPAPTHLDADANGMRMTVAEFEAVETWDRSFRFELHEGMVSVSPAVALGSRLPRIRLIVLLENYAASKAGRRVKVVTADEHDIRIGKSVRRADLVLWTGRRAGEHLVKILPTIAIEFVSASTRDRHRDFVEKRAEYLTAGIAEYWIVDRFRETVTVCTTAAGDEGRSVFRGGEAYRSERLPGFALSFAMLKADDGE